MRAQAGASLKDAEGRPAKGFGGAMEPNSREKAEACKEQLEIVRGHLALLEPGQSAEREKMEQTIAELIQELEYLAGGGGGGGVTPAPFVGTAATTASLTGELRFIHPRALEHV